MFLSLLWASPAFSQEGRLFYNVCQSNAETIRDFQRESITVTTLDRDSIVFISAVRTYSAKPVVGYDFLKGGQDEARFYARKVDDNSFFIASPDFDAFAYYHADKRKAEEDDKGTRCAVDALNSFESSVKSFLAKEAEAAKVREKDEKVIFDAQTKGVITNWIKNYSSKRADPALEKAILQWWKGSSGAVVINPILRIYFLQPTYEITRNQFGEVLRKTVDSLYIYKQKSDGKCYMQWRSFGYESLGGGTFSTEMGNWIKRSSLGYPDLIRMDSGREINTGSQYEVACTPFEK